MKIVKSLGILIAVIGFGILVYFFVYKVEEERKEREALQHHLIRFDLDEMESFTLVRPDSSIMFERGIGRIWNITAPVMTEANNETLQELFDMLNSSEILYTVDEKPKNLEIYGLDNPQYCMVMNHESGDSDTLFLGNETPDGSMTYVKFAGENRVLTIDRALTTRLRWAFNTYRARTIFNILASDVTAVEIIRGNDERINMINNGSRWLMTTPWKYAGDESNMKELVNSTCDAVKTTLIAEKSDDLSPYGLDYPSLILSVSLKHGMPEKMILVGKRLEELGAKHLWYAKTFNEDLIFTLDNKLVTTLTYKAEWYIEKNPMKFSKERLDRIMLETGNQSVVFVKDAQRNWSVVEPVDKNLEMITINKIFACSRHILLNGLFAFTPTEEDISKAGLDKPNFVLTFYYQNAVVDRVEFGDTFTLEDQLTYFRTGRTPIIYLTKSPVTAEINKVLATVFGES